MNIWNDKTKLCSTTIIEKLPAELLSYILHYFTTDEIVTGPMLVNKTWRDNIISNVPFWQHLLVESATTSNKLQPQLKMHQKYCGQTIKSLCIPLGSDEKYDEHFLSNSFPSLQSFRVYIEGRSDEYLTPICSFLKSHSQLVELHLQNVTLTMDVEDILLTLPRLERLKIHFCAYSYGISQITSNSEELIAHPLKELAVSASGPFRFTHKYIRLKNLECLTMDASVSAFFKVYRQSDNMINFAKLRSFTLFDWKHWEKEDMEKIEMPALEDLEFTTHWSIKQRHAEAEEMLPSENLLGLSKLSLSNLKRLRFSYYPHMLREFVRLAPNLEELNIDTEIDYSSETLQVISKWINLRVLSVIRGEFTDKFISNLGKVLPPQLKVLKLDSWIPGTIPTASIVKVIKNRLEAANQSKVLISTIELLTINSMNSDDMESIEWLSKNIPYFSYNSETI